MDSHGLLMQLTLLICLILAATATTPEAAQAKTSCQNSCGSVSIPYPFGTTDGCYISKSFLITCDSTVNPPRALLDQYDKIQVHNISLQGHLRISLPVAYDCYFNGERTTRRVGSRLLKFPISITRNKFTAVGCDTFAIIRLNQGRTRTYGTGCLSLCDKIDTVMNGSCSGLGCCQTSIPGGVRDYLTTVNSYNNHSSVIDFNPCSYAFVVEDGGYNFSSLDLVDFQKKKALPVVLDWTIGNETCGTAKMNQTSYACKENSDCYEPDNGPGYRCNCSEGYQGNPYLPNGCQDIDECKTLSPCNGTCHNFPGSFNCSCPKGYQGDGRKDGTGCIRIPNEFTLVNTALAASIGGGFSFLLLFLGGFWLYKVIRKMKDTKQKEKFFKKNGGMLLQQRILSGESAVEKTKIFTSKELEKATDNFNENRILGQGGQGTVYKGMVSDGSIVAIKKSKIVDESQLEQFINEVVILSQVNHRNVVKLLGCCLETEIPLLVYEFISNGTLFQLIHNHDKEFPFSWELRLQIATEVAGVLAYLHSASAIPIYHRDIKSTNILLDDKYRAKVSDFGTSRSVSIDQTHVTTLAQGTFGYIDPEYFQSNQLTEKSDVYSFGVVVVELLTGQKPVASRRSQVRSLVINFLLSLEENRLFDILDAQVIKEGGKEEIMAVANLAKQCLELNGKKRPTMKEVTMKLEAIKMSHMPMTTQPNFQEGECSFEIMGPSDGPLASTSSYSDYTQGSSLDVHPLLYDTK